MLDVRKKQDEWGNTDPPYTQKIDTKGKAALEKKYGNKYNVDEIYDISCPYCKQLLLIDGNSEGITHCVLARQRPSHHY